MTRALPYWHVDAFADRPFSGNQAAVILLEEWLDDAAMRAISEENAFAETAFLVRDVMSEADWELRWFSPAGEVRLCGHATLASGHVILGRESGDRVIFRTRQAGLLEVWRSEAGYELALPLIGTTPQPWPEAVALLGAEPLEVWRNESGYNLFLFRDEASVRGLVPDLRALAALGDDQFICTAPGTATDIVSRVFVPGGGVDEDSVTGSAHAVLAHFWCSQLGRESFTAYQASQRGGSLTCRREGDRVWLGGRCATVVEGSYFLA
ncbi:PhzF family phenazine biosynthesis protein [Erythrobacter sp.]|uniref:PhzF family phenazine biosynthesis protein n=1 Tax=Erythrobacter sp. TaxID=1042 RepID=UPI00311EFA05